MRRGLPISRGSKLEVRAGYRLLMAEKEILRVRGDIKTTYGKLSRTYAVVEERLERGLRQRGLERLKIQQGEVVLEVGFGTGCSLVEMARRAGPVGKVSGIDLTPEMVRLARQRLEKERLAERVELREGDARKMPYETEQFDVIYISGALELFDTPDIPVLLAEIRRVLKPNGRLGVVSMPREGHETSLLLRMYEWAHRTFPRYASCRPIYVEDAVRGAGFDIQFQEEIRIAGVFPMKIVIARPEEATQQKD